MAHNITSRDQMLTVREPAWHGLGLVLDDHPTPEEARKMVFDWEPITTPIYRAVPHISEDGIITNVYEEIQGTVAVERSDDGHHLGVVGEGWTPISNKELTEVAEAIEGEDSAVKVETAGSLRGGQKVWMLLRLKEPLEIAGDPRGATIPYFALQNGHDGGSSFRGQALMTRIVCDNTAQAADLEAARRGTEFTFRHTAKVKDRIEEAKVALAGWRDSVDRWKDQMEHLLSVTVTPAQVETFVQEFIPMPPQGLISERVIANIENARGDFRGVLNGVTTQDTAHTAYGLVQASVEYSQHYRASRGTSESNRAENRFKRAYLDRNRLTTEAVKLAQEVALV